MTLRSRSGFRTSSARSPRRKTSWQIGPKTGAAGEAQFISGSIAQAATTFAAITADGVTTIRWRGELTMALTLAAASGGGYHGAFGIGIATVAVLTAGVASVPTPLTEDTWDGWVYHRYFSLIAGGPIVASTAADQQAQSSLHAMSMRLEVDSKAMRKEETDIVEYAVIEVVEVGAAAEMRWGFNCRTLVKLP